MTLLEHLKGDPSDLIEDWRSQGWPAQACLKIVSFELPSPWLGAGVVTSLTAVYLIDASGIKSLFVTDRELPGCESTDVMVVQEKLRAGAGAVNFDLRGPLKLAPIRIPKPWGQEIWYTGIEERGVCCFSEGSARTPLPWLQACVPDDLLGVSGMPPVLLKILDPSAEPVTGDLYFELHDEKREVYVVTHIDPGAWPDGVGAIRYGFDSDRVAAAGSEDAFRGEYLAAVTRCGVVRRALDSSPAPATPELVEQERALRAAMDAFTSLRPLQVGDVVRVPLLLPHSLQHGVRTVEFQTPVYERQILAFAQRVLTQDHWDTELAVGRMMLLAPEDEPFQLLIDLPGVSVERIVDFEDFEVFRVTLTTDVGWAPMLDASYAVVMVIEGALEIAGQALTAEEAVILPRFSESELRTPDADTEAVALVALPRR